MNVKELLEDKKRKPSPAYQKELESHLPLLEKILRRNKLNAALAGGYGRLDEAEELERRELTREIKEIKARQQANIKRI